MNKKAMVAGGKCRCGKQLPAVEETAVPYQFCSYKCKLAESNAKPIVVASFNKAATRVIRQNGNFYVEAWDAEEGGYHEVIDNKRYLPTDKEAAFICAQEIAVEYHSIPGWDD